MVLGILCVEPIYSQYSGVLEPCLALRYWFFEVLGSESVKVADICKLLYFSVFQASLHKSRTVYCIFCFRIRKKVYDALIKLQYNFEEAFNNETKTDQLYPVLDFDELNAMKTRIHTILKFVEVCQYRFGQSSVYLNI